MKKIIMAGLLLAPVFTAAQEVRNLDSIVIVATQAAKDSPVAHREVTKEDLVRTAPAQNLPFALAMTPGAVVVGENGTGSGYAYLRIRGSEGSRIQVNLNGITLNNSESQEVFWVNLPSLSGFLENVQVQRGVGTSVNGSGAFGATVNMRTLYSSPNPYAGAELAYGSFNTWNMAIGAGTGIGTKESFLPNGMGMDIRYAHNLTDGYIRNGKGNLQSLFTRLSYVRPDYSIKAYYIYGDQHTGITWEGISRDMLETDRTYNPAGEYTDDQGNTKYYPNETDNYTEHHVQLNYSHNITQRFSMSNTFHMTKGDGYYENYKEKSAGDYIVRRSMDNIYAALSSVGRWQIGGVTPEATRRNASHRNAQRRQSEILLGLNYAYYSGYHYGLMTYQLEQPDFKEAQEYYRNLGKKNDFSTFLKGTFELPLGANPDNFLKIFGDMQYRYVNMMMEGPDNDGALLDHQSSYHFFNPKAGITAVIQKDHQLYVSVYTGSREPSRSDIKESIKAGKTEDLKPERMYDFEGGYRLASDRFMLGVNFYAMEYRNQLVPTGKKSDTGYEIKENVPDSYRRGVELEAGWQPVPQLRLEGNACLSRNKIRDLTIYLDTYDNPDNWNPVTPQLTEHYQLTDLVYSPSFTAAALVAVKPFAAGHSLFKHLEAALTARFVGKQYFDNTSNPDRMLPAYQHVGLTISQPFTTRNAGTFTVSLFADNLLNQKYCASAWAYRAAFRDTGTIELMEGFYPQAGFNAMIKIAWEWGN